MSSSFKCLSLIPKETLNVTCKCTVGNKGLSKNTAGQASCLRYFFYYNCCGSTVIQCRAIFSKATFIIFLILVLLRIHPILWSCLYLPPNWRYAVGYGEEWTLPVLNNSKSEEVPGVQLQALWTLSALRKSFALHDHLLLQPCLWPKVINWVLNYFFMS